MQDERIDWEGMGTASPRFTLEPQVPFGGVRADENPDTLFAAPFGSLKRFIATAGLQIPVKKLKVELGTSLHTELNALRDAVRAQGVQVEARDMQIHALEKDHAKDVKALEKEVTALKGEVTALKRRVIVLETAKADLQKQATLAVDALAEIEDAHKKTLKVISSLKAGLTKTTQKHANV